MTPSSCLCQLFVAPPFARCGDPSFSTLPVCGLAQHGAILDCSDWKMPLSSPIMSFAWRISSTFVWQVQWTNASMLNDHPLVPDGSTVPVLPNRPSRRTGCHRQPHLPGGLFRSSPPDMSETPDASALWCWILLVSSVHSITYNGSAVHNSSPRSLTCQGFIYSTADGSLLASAQGPRRELCLTIIRENGLTRMLYDPHHRPPKLSSTRKAPPWAADVDCTGPSRFTVR